MPGRRFWAYVENLDKLEARQATSDINHMAAAMGTLTEEAKDELFAELDKRLDVAPPKPEKATLAVLRAAGVRMHKG